MNQCLWVYPGQGSQQVSMLHHLPDHPSVPTYLDQASQVLGRNVMDLDSEQSLTSNQSVQLCLYLAGVISSHVLMSEGLQPDYVAGLSIGAWAAATVAGVVSFETGLQLVSLRGKLMHEAYAHGYGMMAVLGAELSTVEQWVDEVYEDIGEVYVANINSNKQIVISGALPAMDRVASLAMGLGATTRRLAINVPSHCPLLNDQAKQLEKHAEAVLLSEPKIDYLSGTSARKIVDAKRIMHDLVFNMCRPIHWEYAMQAAWERGVRVQIEMLPGHILSQLSKTIFPSGECLAYQSTPLVDIALVMNKDIRR